MKKLNFSIFSIALITLLCTSCQKEPEVTLCTANAAAIAGIYKLTAATYKVNETATEVDYFKDPYYETCERDDIVTFNANGTYLYTDAGIVCSPSGNGEGTWSLSGTTSMVIDGDVVVLENFDCKSIIMSTMGIYLPGDRLKVTFTKQ